MEGKNEEEKGSMFGPVGGSIRLYNEMLSVVKIMPSGW